jgi:ketosteroid isomerase-like protein
MDAQTSTRVDARRPSMDELQRLAIEAECTRLVNRFSWSVDAMDYDAVVALFVPDCTFSRADVAYQGHAGLRTSLNSRPRDRVTRHVCSNIVIDVEDADHAAGRAYCVVYGHCGTLQPGEEAPLGAPDSLILYQGKFVRTADGWRIARWHIGLSFRKPAKAA